MAEVDQDQSAVAAEEPWLAVVRSRRRRQQGVDWSEGYARLAACHLVAVCGETLVAVALAGSLFFKVDPAQGREKVLLGLLLTVAPFALVGPLIGPMIDRVRGGQRTVILWTMAARTIVAAAMIPAAASGSLALFPAAFAMLVLAKTYQVSRASFVPGVLGDQADLVEANSKLQLISGVAAMLVALPGVLLLQLGPEWVLAAVLLSFGAATALAIRLPGLSPGGEPLLSVISESGGGSESVGGAASGGGSESGGGSASGGGASLAVGPGTSVVSAARAMSILRGIVGFVTFLVAFELRGAGTKVTLTDRAAQETIRAMARLSPATQVPRLNGPPPQWWFGAVISASMVGGFLGAILAPRMRRRMEEAKILTFGLLGACAVGVVASFSGGGLLSFMLLASGVAVCSALAKQAFDALAQGAYEGHERGRQFAAVESRFQLVWVVGAILPTALHIPVALGSILTGVAAGIGSVLLLKGALRG